MEQKIVTLSKYQDEAIFSPQRFVAIVSGLQGGKTFAGAIWSRIEYDKPENKERNGLISAPTYKILQQSTLPKFFELNPDLRRYYHIGDNKIEAPDRGVIYVRSTENPNTLEGMTLAWAWMDEAGQMKADAWINIQGRLSITRGRAFLTTTPYNMGWLYTDFYERFKDGDPNFKVVQFRSIDSPYFPQEEYDRVRTSMDKRVFERRYMGLFTRMEGLVYEDFVYGNVVRDEREYEKSFDLTVGGIDWGFTAPTAILVIGYKDNRFTVLDEYYETGRTTPELIEAAKNFKDKYNVSRFYADTAEPDRIEEFKRAGIYTLASEKDIIYGVDKVREMIRSDRLLIQPRCKNLLDEFERYHYPEGTDGREKKEVPEQVDCHALDALRYVLATFQPSAGTRKAVGFRPVPAYKKPSFVRI